MSQVVSHHRAVLVAFPTFPIGRHYFDVKKRKNNNSKQNIIFIHFFVVVVIVFFLFSSSSHRHYVCLLNYYLSALYILVLLTNRRLVRVKSNIQHLRRYSPWIYHRLILSHRHHSMMVRIRYCSILEHAYPCRHILYFALLDSGSRIAYIIIGKSRHGTYCR
jgi:hypothetical protein